MRLSTEHGQEEDPTKPVDDHEANNQEAVHLVEHNLLAVDVEAHLRVHVQLGCSAQAVII